jgi:opacity protein-like surface antigen
MKRSVLAFVMLVGSLTGAFAQDELARLPTGFVPGIPVYQNWGGVYVGAQGGYSFANMGLSNSTNDLVSSILRNTTIDYTVSRWLTLADQDTNDFNYGAFAGFNTQWNDVIVGLEANYIRSHLSTSSSGSVGPLLVSSSGAPSGHEYNYSVSVGSSATIAITDVLSLRARAGWMAGPFLPYAFAGGAIGRANVTKYASVHALLLDTDTNANTTTTTTVTFPSNPQQETKNGAFVFGFSAGAGVDVALFENMFVRAEWEYVQFPSIDGINVSINNVRAGIGIKF